MKRFAAGARWTVDRGFCFPTGATRESQGMAGAGNAQVPLLKLLIETGSAIAWVISGSMLA